MILVKFWFKTVHSEEQGVILQVLTISVTRVVEAIMGDESR